MEVNQREIIAVHLRAGRREPVVVGYGRAALPAGALTTSGVAEPREFLRSVNAVLHQAKAKRVNICLSLAVDDMDAREVRYPALPQQELLANIRWDLQQLFGPDDDGERLLDVEKLSRTVVEDRDRSAGEGSHTYVAVSVPRRIVYEYLDPLHKAKIFPEIVDVGAFSLPWAVPRGGRVGYLHVGPQLTHFMLFANGIFDLQRQVGLDLEPVLRNAQADDDLEAELQRSLAGEGSDPAVASSVTSLFRWIDDTLEFIRVQSGAFTVSERMQTLLVSGPGAAVPGLCTLLSGRTGLPVTLALPPLFTGSKMEAAATEAPAYALAAGLALRGLSEL